MKGDPYVYPGTAVLRNRLGLTNPKRLETVERRMAAQRADESVPRGAFDLDHLRAIHRHLFQDVYDWAGEIRTTELSKGGAQFMFRRFIASGMADIASRIAAARPYQGWTLAAFAEEAGHLIGDVNYSHPFREGNGRTQLQFLKQLCEAAGRRLNLRHLDAREWLAASRVAHLADYQPMGRAIRDALELSV